MIERRKKEVKDIFTYEDYCAVTAESSQVNQTVLMHHWDFRDWKSGKSDAKIKAAEIPHIVTFKIVRFKKGQRCLYYNTHFEDPLKKLDFLSRYAYYLCFKF